MKRQAPREFIIVEGKSDTARLREVFLGEVRTIETQGSAISPQTISRVAKVHEQFGAIVLTDPDYPGQQIRQILTEAIPSIKQAHLNKNDARGSKAHQNIGIEYASDEAIIQALDQVMAPLDQEFEVIPIHQLMELGLIGNVSAQGRRDYLAQYFHLGHLNGKQLQRQLALYGIDYHQLKEAMETYES